MSSRAEESSSGKLLCWTPMRPSAALVCFYRWGHEGAHKAWLMHPQALGCEWKESGICAKLVPGTTKVSLPIIPLGKLTAGKWFYWNLWQWLERKYLSLRRQTKRDENILLSTRTGDQCSQHNEHKHTFPGLHWIKCKERKKKKKAKGKKKV